MKIERWSGSVEEFAERAIPDDLAAAEVWICRPARPVLVLGSAQRDSVVDLVAAQAADVGVVRRRSGGGAVFLAPGRSLWLDVALPRGDDRWLDDVRVSVHWLGELWAASLHRFGVDAEVFRSGLQRTEWGRLVCFAALGPGEVTVAGRKVVGISQRRTRAGARFQCLALSDWDPHEVLELLVLDDVERRRAADDLADVAGGVGVPLDALQAEFLSLLSG